MGDRRNRMDKTNFFLADQKYHKANNLYVKKKEYKKALFLYNEVIEIYPDHVNCLNNRACVKDDLGDLRGAIQDLNTALQVNPKYFDAYYNRAYIYKKMKLDELAIRDYTTYNKLNPSGPKRYDALIQIGNIYKDQNKHDEAYSYYCEAVDLSPERHLGHYYCGLILETKEKYSEAIDKYSHSIKLNPEYFYSYYGRGYCNIKIGEYEKAYNEYIFGTNLRYPEYNNTELVNVVYENIKEKSKITYENILSAGLLPSWDGDINKCIIIFPSNSSARIILDPKKIHWTKTYKRHFSQHGDRYKLVYDYDINTIITYAKASWKEKFVPNQLNDYFDITLNKNRVSPRTVGVALFKDGILVAGDIGYEIGKVYHSSYAFNDVPYAGKVLCYLLASELVKRGFFIWDLGHSTRQWDGYKLELGAVKIDQKEYLKLFHKLNPGSRDIFPKKRNLMANGG